MKCYLAFVTVALMCSAVSAVKPARFSSKFQRQQQAPVPHDIYGAPTQPPQEYGPPPQQEYGPPTTTAAAPTTTEVPTTTEALSENVTNATTSGRLTKARRGQNGLYYIYHPNGQLQKVVYSTKKDARSQAVTAQLKYENVEPITAPIFTYDPTSGLLVRYQP